MKYFVIAGEASGDLHGAGLMEALRQQDPQAQFAFLGGDLMARQAGKAPVVHYRRMAFMGFSEVLRHLSQIRANMAEARRAIRDWHPDAVILVDYPGFNLKMARYAHTLGLPVYYYIAPKVWAWKRWRVRQLRRYVDRVLSILPFEEAFFKRYRVKATYVGNPTYAEMHDVAPARDAPEVLLVPGSRVGEIRANLPVMLEACRICGVSNIAIAGAPGIDASLYEGLAPGTKVVMGRTPSLMRGARAALVTSGTATLECAVVGTPQVVCYRSNGSRLTYNIMKGLLSVRYVSLPNLIADSAVVPEMLLHRCTAQAVAAQLRGILDDDTAQRQGLAEILQRLDTGAPAPRRAARAIVDGLKSR